MAEKKSFVFYHEWGAVLKKLSPEDIGNVVLALLDYSENGTIPQQLSPIADIVFTAFKPAIDRDIESWENTCKRNSENIKKRWSKNDDTKNTTVQSGTKSYTKNTEHEHEHEHEYDHEYDHDLTPPTPSQGESDTEPVCQNQGESLTVLKTAGGIENHSTTLDEDFNRFWQLYPKKVDKQKALKAWKKLKPNRELQGVMLAALERQKLLSQWNTNNGQFIPNPTTWLNGKRWEDDINALGTGNFSSRTAGGNEFINAVINGVDLDE